MFYFFNILTSIAKIIEFDFEEGNAMSESKEILKENKDNFDIRR